MSLISVTSENYNIIANDTVFSFKNEILKVVFTNTTKDSFVFNINFVDDSLKGQEIKTSPNQMGTELDVIVYNAQANGWTTSPLKILEAAETYIHIYFQKTTDSYLVHYTVFEHK